jgi:hypothetical protein
MAGTTGRRSRAASIEKQAIDQVNASLQDLPEKPKDNLSLREAVNLLQDEIRAALAKGYTHEDLAAIFADQGIEISALTLKRYISSGRNQGGKSKSTAGRTRTRRTRKSDADGSTDSAASFDEAEVDTQELEEAASKPGRRRRTSAAKTQSANSTKSTNAASSRTAAGRKGTSTRSTASTRARRKGTK